MFRESRAWACRMRFSATPPGFSPIQTPIRPRLFDSRLRHRNRTLSGHQCLSTAVCVALTSNIRWADAPGNVLLTARATGLPRDAVANVSQIVTLDQAFLTERVGRLSRSKLELLVGGIELMLGRP